jgi:hypothetical protein
MRSVWRIGPMILALSWLVTGCAHRGTEGCEAWRPILRSQEDVLSVETARAILAHNLTGRRLCGW